MTARAQTDGSWHARTLADRALDALCAGSVGVAVQDRDLRYTWPPAGGAALGTADGEELLGRTDADVYPAEVADRLTKMKQAVLRSAAGARTEVSIADDRGHRALDVIVEPLRDDEGTVVGVATATVDVTDRARTLDETARRLARLAEAEHVAHLGSWEWDVAANRIVWSDGLYAIYGIAREEFDPRYRPGNERIHPDDRERVDAAVRRALETCEPIDIEYRIVRPDGRVRRVRGRAEVIVDDDGRPARLAGTAQDVTEVRAAVEALHQSVDELNLPTTAPVAAALRPRQVEILALVAEGLSNREIADRLFLSESTVKWHVREILKTLRVDNRTQAAARYLGSQ